MLGISERQLRSWERQGFVRAAAEFTFSDLIAMRTLQKLRENGIPPRRITRALESLKQKLSGIRHPLSELKIVSDGRAISVQMSGEKMDAISGQMLFNFDTGDLASVKTLAPRPASPKAVREKEAEAWFQNGLALEETGAPVEEAIAAYQKAVELNPAASGALVNLGTIQYRLRRYKEAEQYYRRATEMDPCYPLAHFNLGNLYDEMGDGEQAREHYERALALNPGYADSHFNLALLSEKRGDSLKALHHWRAYLRLDPKSSWAEIARRQLEKLRDATIVRK